MNSTESKVRVIAGYWEPIAHYQRLGYWFIDDEAEHARHYTQEMVDKLKDYQVTTVAWPGYKGLGLKHEQVEFDRLKPFRKMLERAGIELGVYLQCGSYWAETFYEENPQAREWTALDYWGKPQSYSEYYRCYYRHRPCLTHRAFSDFVGGVAHMLVKDYGVSYFLADNNAQMPCYTPHFEKAFHAFLKEKYATHTPEGLRLFRRRYGHEHVDNIVLPSGSARRPIDAMPGLNDPGMQDWVEFRCILTARNARIISEAAKAANPAVKLCFNISYDYGEFGQLIWGTEAELMTDFADELMSEDSNYPRVEADGRLISHVHTCKHLRALGRPGVFHPPHPEQTEAGRNLLALSLMELAIHNQASLGTVYEFTFEKWDPDPRPATIQLIQKYADIFTDNDAVSEIAVLRSRRSSTNNWSEATQGRLLAQQAIFQAGWQWDNVVESALDHLDSYRLLVLPETISVPDHAVRKIADYVRRGGRVLAVGEALSRNEYGQRRPAAPNALLEGERDNAFQSISTGGFATSILAAWLGLEDRYADRLIAFPKLRHPTPFVWEVDEAKVPALNCNYHALPLNQNDFIAAINHALPGPRLIEVVSGSCSPYVIPTLLRSRRTGALSLHVLNYRSEERVESLTLRLNLRESGPIKGASGICLKTGGKSQVLFVKEGSSITVTIPAFQLYAGVLLER